MLVWKVSMSSALLRPSPDLDVAGFLDFLDRRPDERWELHQGVPRAMVGGTMAHGTIGSNIVAALKGPARERGCRALNGFLVQASETSSFEPDALVLCGPFDDRSRTTDRPLIVFEVLSPSTMDFDRTGKAPLYRRMPSLQQLVFVYQDSTRVESWLRRDEGWTAEPDLLLEPERSLALPSIAGSLSLIDIYADVVPYPVIPRR